MKVSVILPTIDEAECIEGTLRHLTDLEGDFEILVVDGGSRDATVPLVRRIGIPVETAPRGRAAQMNHGARLAGGDVFLFLHADTRLPLDAHARIAEALESEDVVGGCFQLRFEPSRKVLDLYALSSRFRFRWFHYGDQAFFVRREFFEELGGYRPYPIMEDLDLWLRMARTGRLVVVDRPVYTSARRFMRVGVLFQPLLNVALVFLYLLGVSPFTLERFYRQVR